MLEQTQLGSAPVLIIQEVDTAPLPVLSAAAFVEVPYTPALLLECRVNASICKDALFSSGCEYGFDAYFEEMYEFNQSRDDLVFVEKCYTWVDVVAFVIENVFPSSFLRDADAPPLAFRLGIVLGWLSAHALVNRSLAVMALEIVHVLLVSRHQGLVVQDE